MTRGVAQRPAIDGGMPVRETMLPYGRQHLEDDDIDAVAEVLRSDWLTTGPKVAEFEEALAEVAGAREAVAVSSGTAALHAAMHVLDIAPRDEVIVPAITFAASANCVLYQGGTPVFADVDPHTLLLDPDQVESKITPRTAAIIAVDYAGQPCDYDALRSVADGHAIPLVADACHALGGRYRERPVGSLADMSVFSFHPVKQLTAGEGGAIVTDNARLAQRMRTFRNHGITSDHHQRAQRSEFFYEMEELGYNYRITDFQCALGLSQLRKLPEFLRRRRDIAARYDSELPETTALTPLAVRDGTEHAYHLYPVLLDLDKLSAGRDEVFSALRAENIGVNVLYVPVYWHPYYRRMGYHRGLCPVAEAAYEGLLVLPMFYAMTDQDVDDVLTASRKVVAHYLA